MTVLWGLPVAVSLLAGGVADGRLAVVTIASAVAVVGGSVVTGSVVGPVAVGGSSVVGGSGVGPVVAGVLDVVGGSGQGSLERAVDNSGIQQLIVRSHAYSVYCDSLKKATSLRKKLVPTSVPPKSIRSNAPLVIIN